MKILRVLDAIGEAVGRWRFRGKCGTCAHFAGGITRLDHIIDPGTDGHCTNGRSEYFAFPVFRTTACDQHEVAR